MAVKRRRRSLGPPPALGSQAFGHDTKGRPTGSAAFSEPSPDTPLKGALLFGNDPEGNPRGSDAFGGASAVEPLRGALLFGNDPMGNPRGADSFGGSEAAQPLKGAILIGNDPEGNPTGSEAFGGPDAALSFRGAASVGAPQLVPERIFKDEIGYDFGGTMLVSDESGLVGLRKDPRDRLRVRVLRVLEQRLAVERERVRHGLGEDAIPWGRIRRDSTLDRPLAETLRAWYRKAPGEVLGIGHVRDVLEECERMHTFTLNCSWDTPPVTLAVHWGEEPVAYGSSATHRGQDYFVFREPEGEVYAYVDRLVPHVRTQRARIRDAKGVVVGTFALGEPASRVPLEEGKTPVFRGLMVDDRERPVFELREERAAPQFFRATLVEPGSEHVVGSLEDRLTGGRIRTAVELDLAIPQLLAWAVAALIADLARLRRSGWPEAPAEPVAPAIEPAADALGPRRPRRT